MLFKDVKAFFELWDFDADKEKGVDANDLHLIKVDASNRHGHEFSLFVKRNLRTMNNKIYVDAFGWRELHIKWDKWQGAGRLN